MAGEGSAGRQPAWIQALRDGGEFCRDCLYLASWGTGRLRQSVRTGSGSTALRGCAGFLASAAPVLVAGLLWRRRRA